MDASVHDEKSNESETHIEYRDYPSFVYLLRNSRLPRARLTKVKLPKMFCLRSICFGATDPKNVGQED